MSRSLRQKSFKRLPFLKKVQTNLFLLFLSFISSGLVLIATSRYGPGISPDSAVYISAANNLMSGDEYLTWSMSPLVSHPPLFPTILAVLGSMGIDVLTAARFFNAIVLGMIVFASGILFRRAVRSEILSVLGAVTVSIAFPLLRVSVMVWTEPLFILLAILFILCLDEFLRKKKLPVLAILSVITTFSLMQRYIGITLVATGFISIVFLTPKEPFLRKLKYGVGFCVMPITVFLIWTARNYILAQTFWGHRFPSQYTFTQNIWYSFNVLTSWVMPSCAPSWLKGGMSVSVLCVMFIAVFFYYSRFNRTHNDSMLRVLPSAIFVSVYCFFLLNVSTMIAFDKINDRLLSAIYVFVILMMLVIFDRLPDLLKYGRSRQMANYLVIAFFIPWLIYSLGRVISMTTYLMYTGAGGYNTVSWRESPLIEWLQTHELDGEIYSNVPDALYVLSGKRAEMSPHKNQYASPYSEGDDLERFKDLLEADNKTKYFVWFKGKRTYLRSIREIREVIPLRKIAVLPDGMVFDYVSQKEKE